jgi:tetratricopeptide (TPR) repeat protein
MPRPLIEYRVFIGSPRGLAEERQLFRDTILRFNEVHGNPNGVIFAPIGWEDTLPGAGRPQEIINEDLRKCDYAIFVLHDRWGTPTGSGKTSGTEEEWELAEELYAKNIIRNLCLFFKELDPGRLNDQGPQLKQVLEFQRKIEAERKHYFQKFTNLDEFREILERCLADWSRKHRGSDQAETKILIGFPQPSSRRAGAPSFRYWLAESRRLMNPQRGSQNIRGALFCAEMAMKEAKTDVEWADAENERGAAFYNLYDFTKALESFSNVVDRFGNAANPKERMRGAFALVHKGITLDALGREAEAIAVWDDVINRFGTAGEPVLREAIARALVAKGIVLGACWGAARRPSPSGIALSTVSGPRRKLPCAIRSPWHSSTRELGSARWGAVRRRSLSVTMLSPASGQRMIFFFARRSHGYLSIRDLGSASWDAERRLLASVTMLSLASGIPPSFCCASRSPGRSVTRQ